MIAVHSDGRRRVPVRQRNFARTIVLLATFACIGLFAWDMRPATNASSAVVRVSLSAVPEERVVNFGHEFPRLAIAEPIAAVEGAGPVPPEPDPRSPVPTNRAPAPAIAGQTSVPREQRRTKYAKPDANGVLPIGYSLAQGVSSEIGGVGVPKTIASEGGEATGLTIFLIGGSLIEVDRGELVTALARLGASDKAGSLPAAGESGRLSLDRVRTAGLDLRYDAIRDRLVLRP